MILTSGAAALRPKKGAALGSALNAGVISATAALADELAEKRIRVNTVVPGLVKTELWDKLGHSKEKQDEIFESGAKRLPVGFVATPEDVAEAYLYLVRADYANGSTVVIGKWLISERRVDANCCRWWRFDLGGHASRMARTALKLSLESNVSAYKIQARIISLPNPRLANGITAPSTVMSYVGEQTPRIPNIQQIQAHKQPLDNTPSLARLNLINPPRNGNRIWHQLRRLEELDIRLHRLLQIREGQKVQATSLELGRSGCTIDVTIGKVPSTPSPLGKEEGKR